MGTEDKLKTSQIYEGRQYGWGNKEREIGLGRQEDVFGREQSRGRVTGGIGNVLAIRRHRRRRLTQNSGGDVYYSIRRDKVLWEVMDVSARII